MSASPPRRAKWLLALLATAALFLVSGFAGAFDDGHQDPAGRHCAKCHAGHLAFIKSARVVAGQPQPESCHGVRIEKERRGARSAFAPRPSRAPPACFSCCPC